MKPHKLSVSIEFCPPKPRLEKRPLLNDEEVAELTALFKVLANGTRLRLVHALALAGEMCVAELGKALSMKPQAISNQLQRLADRGILGFRRQGLNIYYRILDPCITRLLEFGLCLVEDARERKP